jgi:hypothetical protein
VVGNGQASMRRSLVSEDEVAARVIERFRKVVLTKDQRAAGLKRQRAGPGSGADARCGMGIYNARLSSASQVVPSDSLGVCALAEASAEPPPRGRA